MGGLISPAPKEPASCAFTDEQMEQLREMTRKILGREAGSKG